MIFKKGSIRKSLRYSLADGVFTSVMLGVSENYLIPYAIALGATSSQVAFLVSIPILVAALLQARSASVTQSIGSRIKLINFCVFFHALAWGLILLSRSPWMLLGALVIFHSFGAFSVPAWQSLMSDYIPTKKRGEYFGWRNRFLGLVMIAASVLSGLFLNHFHKTFLTGFMVIFSVAMLCRFLAWGCLTRMAEPFRRSSHDVYFSFIDFLKQIRHSNFAKFGVFMALMIFSVNISAPLLAVFLLRDAGFDYASYMVVVTTANLAGFLGQGLWGRWGDRVGNLRALKVATWGIAVLPLFWMVSLKLWYLFLVQFVGGFFWGGFNLLQLNFVMEAVSPEKRIRCLSYLNVMNALALLLGSAAGGALIHRLPPFFGYSFLTLFLISCLVRLLVVFFMSAKVREVRLANV